MKRTDHKTRFVDTATRDNPFRFANGTTFDNVRLAYKTYGTLSAHADNAILLFPVLTTSQNAAGRDTEGPGTPYWSEACHPGWWEDFIGPGRALDTDRYFIVCANYLGGCFGSTGPSSINPQTGQPYGRSFPALDVRDIVDSQARLIDLLGIERLHAVVGASFGGYLAYDLARRYPALVDRVVSIASGCRVTAEMKHSNLAQILAIECDRDFQEDRYDPSHPCLGLRMARMIALKTYVGLNEIERRSRKASRTERFTIGSYTLTDGVERFFWQHAQAFVKRFDAHTYLRLLGAWQRFDAGFPTESGTESVRHLAEARAAFAQARHQQWLLFSIDSDSCFPPIEQRHLGSVLAAAGIRHNVVELKSEKGHDSFLAEPPLYIPHIRAFLDQAVEQMPPISGRMQAAVAA